MSTFTIFLVLITIVCFLLIVVIMVQNPKGGGLSSSISGSTQMGGVQKTTDFLYKSTWYLGAILIVLILMSSLSFNGNNSDTGSKVIDESALAAPAIPTAPQATPAATKTTETPATKPVTEGTKK
ncbi:preprotein translocase subunit SecG [Flavobacterium psychrophilum]|uniref:preprotein translocase subunit SecG n=1 Tax=Flavobacterium psychrophilum TaxID=96345 RepID=UPI000B7C112A|nr:preprotein translocase subunit SecG [Flavobacterium psychrophilum]EKT4519296.1 preprotein translocase subunit SecG [Flavobacterium psychrophilum]MCB6061012.1 preprotein translocase subunit SecG [Flavobacterium psychrophilum]MCB6087141.1 preprotein translocase subunit SecG [Flavobacterium psychrophilum]QRE60856.1 preprotein translocase subunit SecG [Flavobacterium psychrophilum]QRE63043.1 preprotein translocase subunit SecG [Flavobacterium psychrophilum]